MNSHRIALAGYSVVLGLLALCSTDAAQAQGPGQAPAYGVNPGRKPVVSPYINLLRSGTDPGINYYGIVRPEIAFRNSIQQVQEQQQQLVDANQQQTLATYMTLPTTGHVSGFQTQTKYFQTKGGQAPLGIQAPVPAFDRQAEYFKGGVLD